MKKIIAFMLCFVTLFVCSSVLIACDNHGVNSNTFQCSHSYVLKERKATCINGGYATYRCSLCNEIKTEYEKALGHTTNSGTCTRCGEIIEKEVWGIAYYVDEFNNPTNQAYMRNTEVFVGVFSNSATTNSIVYARVLIDSEDIAIRLWEYGSNAVKGYTTTTYNIIILDDNEGKHYTTGTLYKNGDRIFLEDNTFIALLQMNNKLKIYIEEDSKYGYNSNYIFEAENGNFNTELSKLFQ